MFHLYLDSCCYNRPFDDLRSDRVRLEAEAIFTILRLAEVGVWNILGSDILLIEIAKMRDTEKRRKAEYLYKVAREHIPYSDDIELLSAKIQTMANIQLYDSLHLASAIIAGTDVLLTTDDKFIKACHGLPFEIRVMNPILWYLEVEC